MDYLYAFGGLQSTAQLEPQTSWHVAVLNVGGPLIIARDVELMLPQELGVQLESFDALVFMG